MTRLARAAAPYRKAIAAGLAAGLTTAISTAVPLVDDGLAASEVLTVLGAFVAAAVAGSGLTYAAPRNASKE